MLINHPIVLQNERVMLRPLELEDIQYLSHFAQNEPDLWRYSLAQIQSPADLELYINQAVDARAQGREYPFIVFDKATGLYAGSTRFYDIQLPFKTLQLGYTWYGKAYHGTGLNKHCKYLLLEYAFQTLGLERVEFRADNRNERSKRAMQSIGCTVEGVLRNHLPTTEGGRRDSIILSILQSEWHAGLKDKLYYLCHNTNNQHAGSD
jgi:RimJ/RimL family protein N-acetyltransferase